MMNDAEEYLSCLFCFLNKSSGVFIKELLQRRRQFELGLGMLNMAVRTVMNLGGNQGCQNRTGSAG
jgi:hypothetical protein